MTLLGSTVYLWEAQYDDPAGLYTCEKPPYADPAGALYLWEAPYDDPVGLYPRLLLLPLHQAQQILHSPVHSFSSEQTQVSQVGKNENLVIQCSNSKKLHRTVKKLCDQG